MTMDQAAWEQLNMETRALTDPTCSGDANIQHLINVLLGYRETIIDPDSSQCEYASPGSARANSWNLGREIALRDLTARNNGPH